MEVNFTSTDPNLKKTQHIHINRSPLINGCRINEDDHIQAAYVLMILNKVKKHIEEDGMKSIQEVA